MFNLLILLALNATITLGYLDQDSGVSIRYGSQVQGNKRYLCPFRRTSEYQRARIEDIDCRGIAKGSLDLDSAPSYVYHRYEAVLPNHDIGSRVPGFNFYKLAAFASCDFRGLYHHKNQSLLEVPVVEEEVLKAAKLAEKGMHILPPTIPPWPCSWPHYKISWNNATYFHSFSRLRNPFATDEVISQGLHGNHGSSCKGGKCCTTNREDGKCYSMWVQQSNGGDVQPSPTQVSFKVIQDADQSNTLIGIEDHHGIRRFKNAYCQFKIDQFDALVVKGPTGLPFYLQGEDLDNQATMVGQEKTDDNSINTIRKYLEVNLAECQDKSVTTTTQVEDVHWTKVESEILTLRMGCQSVRRAFYNHEPVLESDLAILVPRNPGYHNLLRLNDKGVIEVAQFQTKLVSSPSLCNPVDCILRDKTKGISSCPAGWYTSELGTGNLIDSILGEDVNYPFSRSPINQGSKFGNETQFINQHIPHHFASGTETIDSSGSNFPGESQLKAMSTFLSGKVLIPIAGVILVLIGLWGLKQIRSLFVSQTVVMILIILPVALCCEVPVKNKFVFSNPDDIANLTTLDMPLLESLAGMKVRSVRTRNVFKPSLNRITVCQNVEITPDCSDYNHFVNIAVSKPSSCSPSLWEDLDFVNQINSMGSCNQSVSYQIGFDTEAIGNDNNDYIFSPWFLNFESSNPVPGPWLITEEKIVVEEEIEFSHYVIDSSDTLVAIVVDGLAIRSQSLCVIPGTSISTHKVYSPLGMIVEISGIAQSEDKAYSLQLTPCPSGTQGWYGGRAFLQEELQLPLSVWTSSSWFNDALRKSHIQISFTDPLFLIHKTSTLEMDYESCPTYHLPVLVESYENYRIGSSVGPDVLVASSLPKPKIKAVVAKDILDSTAPIQNADEFISLVKNLSTTTHSDRILADWFNNLGNDVSLLIVNDQPTRPTTQAYNLLEGEGISDEDLLILCITGVLVVIILTTGGIVLFKDRFSFGSKNDKATGEEPEGVINPTLDEKVDSADGKLERKKHSSGESLGKRISQSMMNLLRISKSDSNEDIEMGEFELNEEDMEDDEPQGDQSLDRNGVFDRSIRSRKSVKSYVSQSGFM